MSEFITVKEAPEKAPVIYKYLERRAGERRPRCGRS